MSTCERSTPVAGVPQTSVLSHAVKSADHPLCCDNYDRAFVFDNNLKISFFDPKTVYGHFLHDGLVDKSVQRTD